MTLQALYERSKDKGQFKSILPQRYVFENEGDSLLGRYLKFTEVTGNDSSVFKVYFFDTDDGVVSCSLGSIIDSSVNFVYNKVYYIEFKGQIKSARGFPMNQFEVIEIPE